MDGKVAAGLPGEVFHGDDRNLVREGTPTSGDCSARFGEPRGASHCEFRFVSRLWGLCRPPLQPSSRLLQGLMRRPPRPTRRRRPLCSSEDPGGGRESGEEGSPAAFPSWVIPSPNLLGRAGDHRPPATNREGLTSLLGPRCLAQPVPGLLSTRKAFGSPLAFAFVLPATLRNLRRSQGGRLPREGTVAGAPGAAPNCQLEAAAVSRPRVWKGSQ